ncbi:MAG: bifunctional heptose 7-phosphate kinase/heptose 1-phosphate adenyltransferase [Pirellulales bacterium]
MTEDRLNEILEQFWRHRIALIGDLFLDRYLYLQADTCELSVETDLETYQIETVRNSPGALGTIVNNLTALGVDHLIPLSVIGEDGHGHDLLTELKKKSINLDYVQQIPDRLTPTYTKPMRPQGEGFIELNRIDIRSRTPLSKNTLMQLQMQLRAVMQQCDGLIVLDQIVEPDQGVVHHSIRKVISQLVEANPKKVFFIDSRSHLGQFEKGILKCNLPELSKIIGKPLNDDAAIVDATKSLSQKTGLPVFTTLGARGICVAENAQSASFCAGVPVTGPIDIVGAGDTATSAMTAALISGATPNEAAFIGNLAASISITQLGTTGVATPAQIVERFAEMQG